MSGTEPQKFGSLSCLDGYNLVDSLWKKHVKPLPYRLCYSQYLLVLLLLIGLFHPTSWQGDISVSFRRSSIYILNFLYLFLFLMTGVGGRMAYRCGLAIPCILLFATILSPLPDITLGAYVFFLPISVLFCMNLCSICWSKVYSICYFVINVLLVGLAFAVICDVALVEVFFVSIYKPSDNYLCDDL